MLAVIMAACLLFVNILAGNPVSVSGDALLQGYYSPDAQPPDSVQAGGTTMSGVTWGGIAWSGLQVGYVGEDKKILNSSFVRVDGLPGNDYGIVETNVTVNQLAYNGSVADTKVGKALLFGDMDDVANSGYILVSRSEASSWIQVLNGVESHVFSDPSVNVYTVTYAGKKFTAYSLAEIANACGAGGNPPSGDGLTKINDNLYLKRDGFKASPRPTAQIGEIQSQYKLGDTVSISGAAYSYSVFDKFVVLDNFSVYKVETDGSKSQYEVIDAEDRKDSYWTVQKSYKPASYGTYEINLAIKDYHDRTTIVYPMKKTFIVAPAQCTKINATLKISGQSDKTLASDGEVSLPKGINTITLVFPQSGTLKVGGTTVGNGTTFSQVYIGGEDVTVTFTPTSVTYCPWTQKISSTGGDGDPPPNTNECKLTVHVETMLSSDKDGINTDMTSGGAEIELERSTDTIQLTAKEKGTFYIGTTPIPSSNGIDAQVPSWPTDGRTFTLKFINAAGKECWEKKFYVSSGGTGEYQCPDFEVSGGRYIEGIRYVGLNDSIEVDAYYTPPGGEKDRVPVYWIITNPDGSKRYFVQALNHHDKETWQKGSSIAPRFETIGTYTIEFYNEKDNENDPYKTWKEKHCDWKITVVVSDCQNIRLLDFKLDGTRKNVPPKDDGSYHLKLYQNQPTHEVSVTSVKDTPDGKHPPIATNWLVLKSGSATPLMTATQQETFTYTFTEPGDYVIKSITTLPNGETCEKIIYVTYGGSCDEISVVARDGVTKNAPIIKITQGSGTESDPYVVPITLGREYKIGFTLSKDGETLTGDYDWETYRDGVRIKYLNNSAGYHTDIPIGSAEYVVRVIAGVEGVNCIKYITFRTPSAEERCEDLYMHLLTEEKIYSDVAPAPSHTGAVTIQVDGTLDKYGVQILDRPVIDGEGAYPIDVTWEADLPNQAPEDFADTLYIRKDTPAGVYTIKATVNEPSKPLIHGCVFVLTLTIQSDGTVPPGGDDPGPGGPIDGGKQVITIFDSQNRQLVANADGVWEREPARIVVTIDQTKIAQAFSTIDGRINQAIQQKIADFQSKYSGEEFEDVQVNATPPEWRAQQSTTTSWPSIVPLAVDGPGIDQSYQLNPKLQSQSNTYTGTIAPTLTTWKSELLQADYAVTVDSFTIQVPYQVTIEVAYSKCEKSDDEDGEESEEKNCSPGTDTTTLSGSFSIQVAGDQTSFEVYEPNATGYLEHTAEWKEYHARDRYPKSVANDFYAGERILTRLQLDSKHRHPYSNQFPMIQSAQAWISELGQRSTPLSSTLDLQQSSASLWKGGNQQVAKLGPRELGVDNPLMGDKQRGFKKGGSYAVYFQVQFAFGVSKGYMRPDKNTPHGHESTDYRVPFQIIANAWERQGIRNHTSH